METTMTMNRWDRNGWMRTTINYFIYITMSLYRNRYAITMVPNTAYEICYYCLRCLILPMRVDLHEPNST